jgi:predicted metal-dependent hydrolase
MVIVTSHVKSPMPTLPGPPPIDITLRRSAQARRFSLRISRVDGRVTLTVPLRAREAEAMAFVAGQEGWLRGTLARMPVGLMVGFGCVLPVEGRMLTIVPGPGRVVRIVGDVLAVPGDAAQVGVRVSVFLKALARTRLVAASDRYSAMVGKGFTRITLRDPRSRWGSCTSSGGLMYAWRLVMAPPDVLDYVAAHEVAHLVEMNHSAAYWAVVSRVYPGWQVQRAWLHTHGAGLQAYRFGG